MPNVIDAFSLHYLGGSSDKVYNMVIEEAGPGYVVNASWGRRGGTLQHGTKTKNPTTLTTARAIFDKFLREKTGEGYRVVIAPGSSGPARTKAAIAAANPNHPFATPKPEGFSCPACGVASAYDGSCVECGTTVVRVSTENAREAV